MTAASASSGEYCSVLTSRQMGKSSHHPLRGYPVYTTARRRSEGVAVRDLEIGQR